MEKDTRNRLYGGFFTYNERDSLRVSLLDIEMSANISYEKSKGRANTPFPVFIRLFVLSSF